jgi:hypothetical protein
MLAGSNCAAELEFIGLLIRFIVSLGGLVVLRSVLGGLGKLGLEVAIPTFGELSFEKVKSILFITLSGACLFSSFLPFDKLRALGCRSWD